MTWQIQSKVRHQVLWRVHVTRSSSCFKIILTDKGIWFNNSFLHHEQLLDEDKDDMKNSADIGRCYSPKPKVSRQFPRVWTDVFSCKSEWHPSSGVPVYSCYLFESITWVSRPWIACATLSSSALSKQLSRHLGFSAWRQSPNNCSVIYYWRQL